MKKGSWKKLGLGLLVLFLAFQVFDLGYYLKIALRGNPLTLSDDYRELEGIRSENAIVVDRETKEIVWGRDYEARIHPASMTKVMTNILALEEIGDFTRSVEIDQATVDYCIVNDLVSSGFEVGDQPQLVDLVYGSLLKSGGEASIGLANHIAGSEEDFADLMNQKAARLGMEGSHFSNSTGITDQDNYSTVKDIAILFDYALENKDFEEIVKTQDYEAILRDRTVQISNSLLARRDRLGVEEAYIKCGKTGYTEAAGLCLVSLGELDGREYIVVTAHAYGDNYSDQYHIRDVVEIYREMEEAGKKGS